MCWFQLDKLHSVWMCVCVDSVTIPKSWWYIEGLVKCGGLRHAKKWFSTSGYQISFFPPMNKNMEVLSREIETIEEPSEHKKRT